MYYLKWLLIYLFKPWMHACKPFMYYVYRSIPPVYVVNFLWYITRHTLDMQFNLHVACVDTDGPWKDNLPWTYLHDALNLHRVNCTLKNFPTHLSTYIFTHLQYNSSKQFIWPLAYCFISMLYFILRYL